MTFYHEEVAWCKTRVKLILAFNSHFCHVTINCRKKHNDRWELLDTFCWLETPFNKKDQTRQERLIQWNLSKDIQKIMSLDGIEY